MIITCPNCQTRYQLANEAIGSAGRKVQCANCQTAWQATPEFPQPKPKPRIVPKTEEDDKLFDALAEKGLDADFAAEEERLLAAAAEARQADEQEEEAATVRISARNTAPANPGMTSKQQQAFSKRRDDMISSLPFAKVRRTMRLVGIVALVLVVSGTVFLRTELVRQFPALADIYASVGLGVNVIGLDFRDVKTVHAYKDNTDLMMISANIVSVNPRRVPVPQVVVTLLDANANALYEWSVSPNVPDLAPGEIVKFETQLASPPEGAERVKLTFTNGRPQSEKAAVATSSTPPSTPAAGAH
jgi:predicted Zn finger-like uncharacterized protein